MGCGIDIKKTRALALGLIATLFSADPVRALNATEEMSAIVRQLNLFVSETLVASQVPQLSPSFRQEFSTKSQLTSAAIARYFSSNPTEVMAFRAYMQHLVDLGFITSTFAEQLVVVAFKSLEQTPQNQILTYSAITRAEKNQNDQVTAHQTYNLPKGTLPESVTSEPEARASSSATIDFGAQLEVDQKASIAADQLERDLEEQKRIERNTQLARAIIDEFSQGKPSPESLGRRVERVVSKFTEQETQKRAESYLDNAEVSVTSVRDGPEYTIRGLKAFDDVNPNYFSFSEFGLTTNEDDTTLNIGIGVRKLSEDQTVMGGLNAFYDHELDTNHQRASVGVELISAPLRFSANRYIALSDGYSLNALETETPLSGHDVDLEAALPYFPGLFAGYNHSTWYGEDGIADIERKTYRLRGQLSKNLSVELGRRQYSQTLEDQNTAQLSYNYVFGADADAPTLLDVDTQPYRHQKIGPRERYRMVERENQIVTQVTRSGLLVTFTAL